MNAIERDVDILCLKDGRAPFEQWYDQLNDIVFKAAVKARISRVADGNFGDHKSVGRGVYELRIPKGPGMRVYYGLLRPNKVILLSGGNKRSQRKDIKYAQKLWEDFNDED